MNTRIILLFFGSFFYQINFAETTNYQNVYLSYVSTTLAQSITQYVKQQHLGGISFWELRGDTPFDEQSSLLRTINTVLNDDPVDHKKPLIISYWNNKNVYSKDQPKQDTSHAPYGIPGSRDIEGNTVINEDFKKKLSGVNLIVYQYLQAQTSTYTYYDKNKDDLKTIENKTLETIGTLYFSDPWTDLSSSGVSSIQDPFCRQNTAICNFALINRFNPIELEAGAKMGNFNAFANLEHETTPHPLGQLRKIISVGGIHHESTFEATINNPIAIDNFIQSAKTIINTYQLDGIDLDYENPQMTHDNAALFTNFVKQFKKALPEKIISITLLPDLNHRNKKLNHPYGFSEENLREMAKYASIINLKTHDFFGPFSTSPEGLDITGFITNLTIPNNAPPNYPLSIENAISWAIKTDLTPSQITLSIPAYGRALAGIESKNNGLYNTIPTTASILQGDLDSQNCQADHFALSHKRCSGIFQYQYIYHEMLNHGFVETNQQEEQQVIGTSAYAYHWIPEVNANFDLKITNIGWQNDITFNISISDFYAPDLFGLGTDKTYTSKTTRQINGKTELTIKWSTHWGPKGECPTSFNFTKNSHILIKITPDNTKGKYRTFCAFVTLPN